MFFVYASVNSTCTQPPPTPPPPPPGYCGTFACLVSPEGSSRGWGICKFCTAQGWAFANPGAIPKLLARTQFPIRI